MNTTSTTSSNCTLEAAGYAVPIIVASIITLIKAINGIFQVSSRSIKRMGSLRQGSRDNRRSAEEVVQNMVDKDSDRSSDERRTRESDRHTNSPISSPEEKNSRRKG